jgi:hypothetical protein
MEFVYKDAIVEVTINEETDALIVGLRSGVDDDPMWFTPQDFEHLSIVSRDLEAALRLNTASEEAGVPA